MKSLFAVLALFAAHFAALSTVSAMSPAARADGLPAATGTVILTIGGNIANANRPPFDPARDGFLKHHERRFDRAAAFDLPMLEALGTRSATIAYAKWPAPVTFSGPLLADVLKAAGWNGTQITTLALDGFGTKIARPALDSRDWILATRADGKPLGIGARGPLWLVFDPPGDRPATDEEEAMWPWALFYIEAE